jgi:hypothetical protein
MWDRKQSSSTVIMICALSSNNGMHPTAEPGRVIACLPFEGTVQGALVGTAGVDCEKVCPLVSAGYSDRSAAIFLLEIRTNRFRMKTPYETPPCLFKFCSSHSRRN